MSDTPRAKLSAKHPRILDKTRAPVRSSSPLRRPTKAVPASMLDGSGAKMRPTKPTKANEPTKPTRPTKPARPRPAGDVPAPAGGARPSGTAPRKAAGSTKPYEKRTSGERPPARGQRERAAGARPARFNAEERPRRSAEGSARGGDYARPVKRGADERPPRRFNEERPRRSAEGSARSGDYARPVKRGADDRPPRRFDEERPRRSAEGSAPGARSARPAPQARPARARRDSDDDIKIHHDAAGSLRLSKRMSQLGLCSRREADEWIAKGWVRVDGKVVTELGTKILPTQDITVVQAAQKEQANRVTVLLHKPVGYVSGQAEDGYEPAVVLVTREHHWSEDDAGIRFSPSHLRSLAPAGRLDIDSTGLLVLTQDGRVAKQLIGEDSEIEKEYLVRVSFNEHSHNVQAHFPAERLALLRHGLALDDQPLKPAQVDWQNPEQLRFVLKEGKKRQIRRMCELVGLHVTGLKRVRMGRITLGNLPVGEWRYLRPGETF
ncbi:pseudouridine synthase [Pandoraea nosoerga]|uniref:pseudouridine synthase n=1 Tax=Pandoraea nosoerga TaxID=2508296 RepID=UPI00197E8BD2|nr:pseudouridine synthase [Pandoraea nosoerga]MBN4666017.1 pseudouridine synthase [Pandoraea nosoerga]MBN4676191.1 pseudouridine synthase [Pandoraea nosoerga]MBN4681211.1 pseudouridine synthase [Pandoraea nosoerga]